MMNDRSGRRRARHSTSEEDGGSGVATWIGIVIAVLLALFLVWWLPARVASGYAVPRIFGSVASLPSRLPVLWVRSWPWQTQPPHAEVVFQFSGGKSASALATGKAPAVGWFSGRAVPATLVLSHIPAVAPGQIVGIQVVWPGGQSSSSEPALWVSAHSTDPHAPGTAPVWTDRLTTTARLGVELPIAQNQDIVALSSPYPTLSPWTSAHCLAVSAGESSTSVRAALLQGKVAGKIEACGALQGGQAVVLASSLPKAYGYFMWQPVVQELINTHLHTFVAGPVEIGTEQPMTTQNWWHFTAAPLPPGF